MQLQRKNLRYGVYGTYATAPDYADKLIRVIQTYNLTAYDVEAHQLIRIKRQQITIIM